MIHYYIPSTAATVNALVFRALKAFMGVNVLLGLFWTASILATSPAFSLGQMSSDEDRKWLQESFLQASFLLAPPLGAQQ